MISQSLRKHGSTINTATAQEQKKCPTLQQYWQMECRAFVGKTTDALLHPPCAGIRQPEDIPYLEYCEKAKAEHGEFVVDKIKKKGLFGDENALILIGVALHANLRSFKVKRDYIEPMYKAWERAGKKATIVWLSMHSQDQSKKLKHFKQSQNDERVAAFNGPINRLVRGYGWKVFDSFALTRGAYSYDGTHYDTTVNYLKAAYIMEWLENNADAQI
ncbi:hypothetical protein SARC_05118 [Sphaeroforma arctica JP610]|uniref:SGNH domain-containing protein n=1 Tax=Sphaeroforma arctica JP610 TaxID=667725 RepID=A0A0L0G1A8_9EUKA|nr:hypothetical protein SARC_05118 [Sphaeroforma arctica JP610]KNC82599.1 hypothetical protein SARC_05118 [Sphaeroforma arctica JP610]|eukprot:XP_014156501.1 hypothetical protein SARC_05118 [Sphaeroforma arctica JP610]